MGLEVREADKLTDLPRMQAIASQALASGGSRYVIHPGDLAWWVHHEDPAWPNPRATGYSMTVALWS